MQLVSRAQSCWVRLYPALYCSQGLVSLLAATFFFELRYVTGLPRLAALLATHVPLTSCCLALPSPAWWWESAAMTLLLCCRRPTALVLLEILPRGHLCGCMLLGQFLQGENRSVILFMQMTTACLAALSFAALVLLMQSHQLATQGMCGRNLTACEKKRKVYAFQRS